MTLREWSKSELDYGRKLLNSGIEGARMGRETFLHGESIDPFLHESARHAWLPALLGACVGILASSPRSRHTSAGKVLGCALLGGTLGFTAGLAWETRRLASSVGSAALNQFGKTRDEHWFEKHPIDYA